MTVIFFFFFFLTNVEVEVWFRVGVFNEANYLCEKEAVSISGFKLYCVGSELFAFS